MIIHVNVKPHARRNEIRKIADGTLAVSTTISPERGKANAAVVAMLAEYFGKSKNQVRIVRGATSRHKTVEIL